VRCCKEFMKPFLQLSDQQHVAPFSISRQQNTTSDCEDSPPVLSISDLHHQSTSQPHYNNYVIHTYTHIHIIFHVSKKLDPFNILEKPHQSRSVINDVWQAGFIINLPNGCGWKVWYELSATCVVSTETVTPVQDSKTAESAHLIWLWNSCIKNTWLYFTGIMAVYQSGHNHID